MALDPGANSTEIIPVISGISFAVAGVALWLRRPANATGRMMVAVAVAWYIGDLQLSGNPAAFAVGFCLFYTSSTILTHLVLALPTGRLTGRVERVTVVVQYLLAPATQIPRYLAEHPPRPQFWGDVQVAHSVWANVGSIVNLIVVVTGRSEREYLMSALQLGVHAFLQKDTPGAAILGALRTVVRGERVIGQAEALTTVLVEFGRVLRERELERRGLTDQEIEILQLAAAGLNNKDIGVQQFWSEITIKRKMQGIYRKLDVKGRAQAVAEAIRLGII